MDKNYLENILKYWTLRKRKAISGFSLRFLWQDDFPITYQRTITFEFSVQFGHWYLEYMKTNPNKK